MMMKTKIWLRASAVALIAAATAMACTEAELPLQPEEPPTEEPPTVGDTASPALFRPVTCTVVVSQAKANCGDVAKIDGIDADLIIGGQGTYINIAISGQSYNAGLQTYTMNVAVQNLIGQKLGTSDGVTVDPNGIKVFFHRDPVATIGAGSVQLLFPDGFVNKTGGAQAYFQYNNVLALNQTSPSRTWTFSVPPAVTTFTFTLYVAAAIQYPEGWVDIAPVVVAPHSPLALSGTVRNVVGEVVPGADIVWSIPTRTDSVTATITSSGTITGKRAGTVQVRARSGKRITFAPVTVNGMTRVWNGSASTNWENKNNWDHAVVPVTADSVFIGAAAPNQPVLSANVNVKNITVQTGATLDIGPFNLTTTGDVLTDQFNGGVKGTSGQLVLSGIARTVSGRLPRTHVTGTYSAVGNICVYQRLQTQSGRVTNTSFRVQTFPGPCF